MPINAELSADTDRGPGYGLIRIGGLPAATGPIDFSLQRSQAKEPFLGPDGRWQATEAWHSVEPTAVEGNELVVAVGPTIVDAIVTQGSIIRYKLTVATGVRKDAATLKVQRLLGSSAAADDQAERDRLQREAERLRQEEAERARQAEEERRRQAQEAATLLAAQQQDAAPAVTEPEATPPPRRRWMLALIPALLALSVAAVAGSWYACLIPIPGFMPTRCADASVAEKPVEPAVPPPAQPAADGQPAPGGQAATTATPTSCAGLNAADCLRLAETAVNEQRLEPARQLFQQAVQLGAAKAAVALGRMYDPDTWSKSASPAPTADWETAVYWYETAARSGDGAGLLGAGRLLCREAKSGIERRQGLKYLREAEAKGAGEAKTLIQACEARGS